MTPRQTALIQEARSHIGLRWRHQGRSWRYGVDCGGLPYCAARSLGWSYEDIKAYSRYPDGVSLRAHFAAQMLPIRRADVQPGDVLLLLDLIPSVWPCHIALVAACGDRLSIIHSSAHEMRVVENRIDPSWEAKIVGCFRFFEIAEEVQGAQHSQQFYNIVNNTLA